MNLLPSFSDTILQTIGNTPLVRLTKVVPEQCADIYVKLEYVNPTGSYKDRMALAIIEEAEKRGALKKGMTIVECTAGGTGNALALICSAKGYRFKVITSDAFAKEKRKAMQLFGAELELVPSEGGKITPDLIPRMIARAEELSKQEGHYWTEQFKNTDALEGYKIMGNEILSQLNKPVAIFCAAIGTAGMFVGVSLALKNSYPDVKLIALEPASAPLLSKGIKGSHKVDGIAVGFVPPLLSQIQYHEAIAIEEAEARKMAKLLVEKEGIFGGASTGLNVVAAIALGTRLGPGHTIVTVACDSGMKYMESGLFD